MGSCSVTPASQNLIRDKNRPIIYRIYIFSRSLARPARAPNSMRTAFAPMELCGLTCSPEVCIPF